MGIYKKYKFKNQKEAEEKIVSIKKNKVKSSIINIGEIIIENPLFDEKGKEIKKAIYDKGWAVDVYWYELDNSPYGWKSHEVDPKNPKHVLL